MLALLVSLATPAWSAEGHVLRIEGVEFFIDVGSDEGLLVGDEVLVERTVEVRDPNTGRTLSDRFEVGQGRVVEVGEHLSLVQGSTALRSKLRLGDVATTPDREPVPLPQPRVLVEPTLPQPASSPGGGEPTGPDPAVVDFLATFEQAQSEPQATAKARIWRAHLRRFPEGATAELATAEVEALKAAAQATPAVAVVEEVLPLQVFTSAPTWAWEDAPLAVTVTVPELPRVVEGALFFRRVGEQTWRHVVLDAQGDTALVGRIPDEAVQPPGIQWYASVRDVDGTEVRSGSAAEPNEVAVRRRAESPGIQNRSQVRLAYEYVDFYQLKGVDQWQQVDADYLYRVDRGPLYSVRVGYGFYGGKGAPVRVIDQAPDLSQVELSPVGFKFGYSELEFRLGDWVGVAARGITGVQVDGFAVGVLGRLRIGREEGTSLLLGASTVGDIGNEFEVELAWDTVERVPMQAGVYVTNQPGVSRDDYGVRLVYEARLEVTEHVQLGGRVGYQLRNIVHGGPSFGATTVFAW